MVPMSYIMFDNNGIETPVMFPQSISHDQMAIWVGMKVVSAGKVELEGSMRCHGKSTSLAIAAREADSKIINDWFNFDW